MTATGKFLKRAWVRDTDAPIGQPAKGKINCPCGQCPPSKFDPSQPDIVCACGTVYTWDGWIVLQAETMTIADWWETPVSENRQGFWQGKAIIFCDKRKGGYEIHLSPSGWALVRAEEQIEVEGEQATS